VKAGEYEEAEDVCLRGIERLEGDLPGIADQLTDRLRDIYTERAEPLRAAAVEAERFCSSVTFGTPAAA
jgi:hypothetical protein